MDPLKFLQENPTPSETPFPEAEFQGRIAKVRSLMADAGIEALLVTHLPNLYYLTGYNTIIPNRYACLILPIEGSPTIHIADVELGAVFATGWIRDVELYHYYDAARAMDLLGGILKDKGLDSKAIGVETGVSGLHVNQHRRLTETLPNASFIDASRLVYEVRKTKSAAEIEYMREAGRLTVLGVEAAMAEIAPGKTDNDLSAACHEAMIRAGSEYFTKWQNIMTGHRTGFHHSFHARFPIAPGDLVYMELGASYKRYDTSDDAHRIPRPAGRPDAKNDRRHASHIRRPDLQHKARPHLPRRCNGGEEGCRFRSRGGLFHRELRLLRGHRSAFDLGRRPDLHRRRVWTSPSCRA